MRRVVAALLAVLLLAACSSNDLADQGDRSRAGKKGSTESGNGKKDSKGGGAPGSATAKGNDGKGGGSGAVAQPGSAPGSADAPEDFGGGDAPSSGIDPSLARASASVQDSPSDAKSQGLTPPYTEATVSTIQGLGKDVRFTMAFKGELPSQVQKDQYMVVAFGVTGRKEGEGFAIGATADEKGWTPYAGSKGDQGKFPGRFEISGNEMIFEVPWSFVEGPRAFEWYSSTGWYGKVANQTHWAFDAVPNGEAGDFPG